MCTVQKCVLCKNLYSAKMCTVQKCVLCKNVYSVKMCTVKKILLCKNVYCVKMCNVQKWPFFAPPTKVGKTQNCVNPPPQNCAKLKSVQNSKSFCKTQKVVKIAIFLLHPPHQKCVKLQNLQN